MQNKRKFFKHIIQVEVLTEDYPLEWDNLENIHYEITQGHASGRVHELRKVNLNGKEMAKELIEQGSDPEFFHLDAKGNEIDD